MKRFFIWGGWDRNVGDIAMLTAECSMFKVISVKNDFNFVPLNSHIIKGKVPVITNALVKNMNKNGDALIIGGGGQLMARNIDSSVSKWQFEISRENLNRIEIPIILYAIGLNEFPYSDGFLSAEAIDHFKAVARRAVSITARDTITKKWIESLGFECGMLPDPAIHYVATNYTLPNIPNNMPIMGFVWAGDRLEQRIAPTDNVDDFLMRTAENLKALCDLYDIEKVVFIPHVSLFDNDKEHHKVFREILGLRYYSLAERVPWLYPESIHTAHIIKGIYRRMSLVVSMRWHGNILALSEQVPSIPMGEHIKVEMFSRDFATPKGYDEVSCDNYCNGLAESVEVVLSDNYRTYMARILDICKSGYHDYNNRLFRTLDELQC